MKTIFSVFILIIYFNPSQSQILASNEKQSNNTILKSENRESARINPIASFHFDQTAFITLSVPPFFGNTELIIMNENGKQVFSETITDGSDGYVIINGGKLPQGNYTAYLISGKEGIALQTFKVLGK